ncbi:hypothetical protein Tco_0349199 [Tanacetum coccineum]
MANLPPNNNEFALAAEVAPDNMNGWNGYSLIRGRTHFTLRHLHRSLKSDGSPEAESEAEAEDENEVEAEAAPIPPHVPANPVPANPVPANPIPEAVPIGTSRLIPFKRLFTDTQVWTGSSSSAAAGHNPEDLTPSHIRSDLDALHRRVKHIEEEDVRADNKRLKMMLDCSENRTRDAWRETWDLGNHGITIT